MTTRKPPKRTRDRAGAGTPDVWSAWEAIEGGRRRGRLDALSQPRSVLLLGMVIIGLLALLYLHTTSEVALANSQLQSERAEQVQLARQDQQLHMQLGEATNPAYVDRLARELGLKPSPGTEP